MRVNCFRLDTYRPSETEASFSGSSLSESQKNSLVGRSWLVQLTSKMDKLFVEHHGPLVSDFDKKDATNKRLAQKITRACSCPESIAELFTKTRLLMRLRDYNLPINNAAMNCSNQSYTKYYG